MMATTFELPKLLRDDYPKGEKVDKAFEFIEALREQLAKAYAELDKAVEAASGKKTAAKHKKA